MDVRPILDHYRIDYSHGNQILVCCPFHGERNASLSFNIQKNVFHCFGCDVSGDIIDFVRCFEHMTTDMEAIHTIRKIVSSSSIQIPLIVSDSSQERKESRKKAFDFYTALPEIDWLKIASKYLYQRGFTSEILRACGVKYNANSIYALVIPLIEQGEFQGYVTRRIDHVKTRKYLNNRGYARSEVLVGNLRPGRVLVVEGLLDRIKAIQYGCENVSALLNWKISTIQTEKLASIATEIVCGLDNDEKGEKGYEYLVSVMRAYGKPVVRFPFAKGKKDICELTQQEFTNSFFPLVKKVL